MWQLLHCAEPGSCQPIWHVSCSCHSIVKMHKVKPKVKVNMCNYSICECVWQSDYILAWLKWQLNTFLLGRSDSCMTVWTIAWFRWHLSHIFKWQLSQVWQVKSMLRWMYVTDVLVECLSCVTLLSFSLAASSSVMGAAGDSRVAWN